MITVEIDQQTATIQEAVSGGWIAEQLKRRARNSEPPPCIRIQIEEGTVNVTLKTQACGGHGGGGRRRPNSQEEKVFELWQKHDLASGQPDPGELQAFLRQLSQLF